MIWLFASINANFAFAGGAAIVSFFLIRQSRRYFTRPSSSPSLESQRLSEPSPERPPSDDRAADSVIASRSLDMVPENVQLHETVRELMGELDSKMSAIQALIRLANDAAVRLESAVNRAERLETVLQERSGGCLSNPSAGKPDSGLENRATRSDP